MNASQELQSSGINWPDRSLTAVYEPFQLAAGQPETRSGSAAFESGRNSEFAAQNESVLDELRKYYVFPADSSVRDFLTVHRTVPQILLEAAPQLIRCFGGNTILTCVRRLTKGVREPFMPSPCGRANCTRIHLRAGVMADQPFEWLQYLGLAQELAARSEEACLRTALSRAYYYVYNLALIRAERNGVVPKRVRAHRPVRSRYRPT